ncbi:S-type pyocin domain-containing protein, partial [Citrobacter sp.]
SDNLWQFEDTLSGVTLLWSRSAGQGRFEWGASQTTVHDGKTGGYSTPPTPVPDSRGIWGLPNPAPESLPPVPGTPIAEEKGPNIETLPIEDRDFNDFIIVDPMGAVPAIYVYFKKEKVPAVEFEIDYYGKLREKYLNVDKDGSKVEFDHLPSQAACKQKILNDDPLAAPVNIRKKMSDIAAIVIKQKAHQQDSETYGGRQHTKVTNDYGDVTKKSEHDSQDLRSAVDSNWNALSKELVGKYGLPESEVDPMRARIHELNVAKGWYK